MGLERVPWPFGLTVDLDAMGPVDAKALISYSRLIHIGMLS